MASASQRGTLSPYLPLAVRAYTPRERQIRTRRDSERSPVWPETLLVLDTETTIDETQRLTFGSYRYYRMTGEGQLACVEEGLFHAPALPEGDLATLREYTAAHHADVAGAVDRTLNVCSLDEFLERVLWRATYWRSVAHHPPAALVGFNLPFDASRLAWAVGEARGGRGARSRVSPLHGGWSFALYGYASKGEGWAENQYRPRFQVKTIDSKRHLMGLAPPKLIDEPELFDARFRGAIVDLRTLAFALTDESHSLASACEAFGVEHGKEAVEEHGAVTSTYIDYNRGDVRATGELYEKLIEEYRRHPIELPPSRAYSPASIGKAYLRSMGIRPVLERQPDFPSERLGQAMSAYFGGRAECRIRHVPVPVVSTDFIAMYATNCSLLGLWDLVTCQEIEIVDATEEVRELLARATLDDCFNPKRWRELVGLALLEPDGDILPARSHYGATPGWQIGVNPLFADDPLWFSIPDALAAKVLRGRPPSVVRAWRMVPRGKARGLKRAALRGEVEVDPATEDFFRVVIEERKRHTRHPDSADAKRLNRFLKVLASSTTYGIYAEMVRRELAGDATEEVMVHGLNRAFKASVHTPEAPGEFCFPPMAACITGAARLMLALVERLVTDAGGAYAFCDTDSMAIVAAETGGLIRCPDGDERTDDGQAAVWALSVEQIEQIRARFEALNPYDRELVPGSILELEDQNFADPERSERRQLYCLATSAKRYALYGLDERGEPMLRRPSQERPGEKWSEHGLGHLLNPSDPESEDRDWIRALWEFETLTALGLPATEPEWLDRPALGRITVSKPTTARAFEGLNAGKTYADQIKPFNFMLTAHVRVGGHPPEAEPERFQLIAPWEPDSRRWLELDWINRYSGEPVRVTVAGAHGEAGVARIKTYRDVLGEHRVSPESKSLAPDGGRSGWHTRGLLQRRPVHVTRIVHIGKESNELEEVQAGTVHAESEVLNEYRDPRQDVWAVFVAVLGRMSAAEIVAATGRDRTTVWRWRNGRSEPRGEDRAKVEAVAAAFARAWLVESGLPSPRDHFDCATAYLRESGASAFGGGRGGVEPPLSRPPAAGYVARV